MPQASISTLIKNDVVATLNNVTPPVYPVTLLVEDPTQRKPSPTNGYTYVLVGDATRMPDDETPAGWMGWVRTIGVNCVIIQDDDSTTPLSTYIDELSSSVIYALLQDTSRGGLALDTIPTGIFPDYTEEGETWVQITFDIHYRTSYSDPFNPQ